MRPVLERTDYLRPVEAWLRELVIGHGLCPFARQPYEAGRIRLVVSEAREPEALLLEVLEELLRLRATPLEQLETSLLILPHMLQDFLDYNDFLDLLDGLLQQQGMEGEFQIASMHPHYRFAGTRNEDAENYTNRSPYPILHLLREASIEQALASFPHPERIPERNIAHMQQLGTAQLQALLAACLQAGEGQG